MARRDPRQAHLTDLLPSGPKIVRMYAIPMQRLAIITPIKLRILVEALTIYVRLSEGPKDQFSALAIHVMVKVHPRSTCHRIIKLSPTIKPDIRRPPTNQNWSNRSLGGFNPILSYMAANSA